MENKNITDKYPCKKCGERMMYPNIAHGLVDGYKCDNCGTVNHPVRDMMALKPYASKKNVESSTETSSSIPPLVIMRGTEFVICDADCNVQSWLKPKHMRRSSAFVISDPDGSLLESYGRAFKRNGYIIKVLNTANFSESVKYNPFEYIRGDNDIAKLAAALISGTKGCGKPGDFNFLLAETLLFTALISYIQSEAIKRERNVNTLIEIINYMDVYADKELNYRAVVLLLDELAEEQPEHLAVQRFNDFKETAGKKVESVIESCAVRLLPLDTEETKVFLSDDELGLDWLFYPQTALFVVNGDTDAVFNFIAPLMYSQLLNLLFKKSVQ